MSSRLNTNKSYDTRQFHLIPLSKSGFKSWTGSVLTVFLNTFCFLCCLLTSLVFWILWNYISRSWYISCTREPKLDTPPWNGLTSAEQKGRITPMDLQITHLWITAQDIYGLLWRKGTLLDHGQFVVHQNPKVQVLYISPFLKLWWTSYFTFLAGTDFSENSSLH